jgi:acyl-CoA reductase-like NAD-dependent aldehyde dehydrogenase
MVISHDRLFIGGQWVPPSSAAIIEVRNASTGERAGTVREAAEADVDAPDAASVSRSWRGSRLTP